MAKGGSGGAPGSNIFNETFTGPPPGNSTVTTELWIDLGLIPSGYSWWFGMSHFVAPDKTIKFELRTNTAGQSAGTDAKTTILAATSCRAGTDKTSDLYRNGRLHITTVVSTGTEHAWLKLIAKGNTAGSYLYTLTYVVE